MSVFAQEDLSQGQQGKKSAALASAAGSKQIEFENVTIVTPTGNTLVEGLTFAVKPGTNMLLTGPNGAGKSSLFRALGGLWEVPEGEITKPGQEGAGLFGDVFYLPQKPYNVIGNLRDQLTYPETNSDAKKLSADRLRELLALVDLEYLANRETDSVNWEETLSIGETQRLAMARLFYHCPTFAILDECTSGVSSDMERRLYRLCADRNITCITISHRPALIAYHDMKLELDGNKGYTFTPIAASAKRRDSQTGDRIAGVVQRLAAEGAAGSAKSGTTASESKKHEPLVSALAGYRGTVGFVARLRKLLVRLVPSATHPAALRLYALSGVVVSKIWLSNFIAHQNGDTVRYLLNADFVGYKRLLWVSLAQCVASAVLAPSLQLLTRQLALGWRQTLTKHLQGMYFKSRAFYKMVHLESHTFSHGDRAIGADHILTEDVDKLCTELANIFPDVVKPLLDVGFFTYQTQLLLGPKNTAYLYMYIVAGLGFLKLITPNFNDMQRREQLLSSTYRYVHQRVRTHGESIAFFGGDDRERSIVNKHFKELMVHEEKQSSLDWKFGVANDFISARLPHNVTWGLSLLYALQTPEEENRSAVEFGGKFAHDLRYVAAAVSQTFVAFSELLQLYKRFQQLDAYLGGVSDFETMLEAIQAQNTSKSSTAAVTDSTAVAFRDVDVVTPTGTCLAAGLSFQVQPKHNMLVSGPNASGKTSLFRVLGGLWPLRAGGSVSKPGAHKSTVKDIFFVPQRPYNVAGNLADLITYPFAADLNDKKGELRLRELLAEVGLSYLLGRESGWKTTHNWADVLSLGEQQRLGMARLFWHSPKFAVLDQCTDAVSVDVERKLYQYAAGLGITIITISQRPGLLELHDQWLRLEAGAGGDRWSLEPIQVE